MSEPLVGLMGYAQSGKDTFAGLLGYRRIAFADKLKDLALACSPLVGDQRDAGDLETIVSDFGWEYAKAKVPGVREFLQNLGVGVRDILGRDLWVHAALSDYEPGLPTVITDVRFLNEIAEIKNLGGFIVRIDRPGIEAPNNHVSEHGWQDTEPDLLVVNDGDLAELEAKARILDRLLRRRLAGVA